MSEEFSLKVTASSNPSGDTKINLPLNKAIDAIRHFRAGLGPAMSPNEVETIKEVERRLLRLAKQYKELLQINTRLMETDRLIPDISVAPSGKSITFKVGGESIQIALPVGPYSPQIAQRSVVGAYIPGGKPEESEEIASLRSRMETLLEGFYQGAHRLLKLFKGLSGFKNVEARAITMVRNKLIEHPNPGDCYTFGYSTSGPLMRPLRPSESEWTDAGLIPNTQEFVDVLKKAFEEHAT